MVEGSHDIIYLFGVTKRVVFQIPVVNNKGKVIPNLDLLCNLIPVSKGVTHDGN